MRPAGELILVARAITPYDAGVNGRRGASSVVHSNNLLLGETSPPSSARPRARASCLMRDALSRSCWLLLQAKQVPGVRVHRRGEGSPSYLVGRSGPFRGQNAGLPVRATIAVAVVR
jgi:hypothetical protein